MHCYDVHEASYLNCENNGLWDRGSGPRVRPIWSFGENVLDLKKSSLFLNIFEKNKFNDSDVHYVFHVSCEIHGPWDKCSGIREWPKWTDSSSINILNLRKSSPIPYKFEKN